MCSCVASFWGIEVPNQPKTPMRSVRIADPLWTEVAKRADLEGQTVTAVIREALERYVDAAPAETLGGEPPQTPFRRP